MPSKIEWTEDTWNPTTGCDQVSPGCGQPMPGREGKPHGTCYALTLAKRLQAMENARAELGSTAPLRYQNDGDPRTSGPGFGFTMHPDRLDLPLRWQRPRRVFVNSMSDLFHAKASRVFLAQVFAVMSLAERHSFQVLTKRSLRMQRILTDPAFEQTVREVRDRLLAEPATPLSKADRARLTAEPMIWPLPNLWLGVSVEDQDRADERIPHLLATPAAIRWISAEPLLGPIDLLAAGDGCYGHWLPDPPERDQWGGRVADGPLCQAHGIHGCTNRDPGCVFLDWVVVGGESGPGSRWMHPDWARQLRDQCTAAGVAFNFKQHGDWMFDGHYGAGRHLEGGVYVKPYLPRPANMHEFEGYSLSRVGKTKAGRLLDGELWDEYPAVAA